MTTFAMEQPHCLRPRISRLAQCSLNANPRHRHQEFPAFLRRLDECIPPELDVHLIVENYATHKHPKVRTWLAQRPRYQIHYTRPILPGSTKWNGGSASSLNAPFAAAHSEAFRNWCRKLMPSSTIVMLGRSHGPHPADSILSKLTRLCLRISGTRHSAPTYKQRQTQAIPVLLFGASLP